MGSLVFGRAHDFVTTGGAMIDLLPSTVLLSEPQSRSLDIGESTIKQISRSDESLSLRMVTTRGRRRRMLHTMDRHVSVFIVSRRGSLPDEQIMWSSCLASPSYTRHEIYGKESCIESATSRTRSEPSSSVRSSISRGSDRTPKDVGSRT
jgi:hypothetical protein